MTRPIAVRLLPALILAGLLAAGFATASASTTPWVCGPTHCKYDQARVQFVGSNGIFTDQQHHIWGSTISGTCDPENNEVRWRLSLTELWVDGVRLFGPVQGTWHTNCQIDLSPPPPTYWYVTVNRTYDASSSAYAKHQVFHDYDECPCDFTDTIINNLPF
jgi:hypothetical protein